MCDDVSFPLLIKPSLALKRSCERLKGNPSLARGPANNLGARRVPSIDEFITKAVSEPKYHSAVLVVFLGFNVSAFSAKVSMETRNKYIVPAKVLQRKHEPKVLSQSRSSPASLYRAVKSASWMTRRIKGGRDNGPQTQTTNRQRQACRANQHQSALCYHKQSR
jgi:hypothetical protein